MELRPGKFDNNRGESAWAFVDDEETIVTQFFVNRYYCKKDIELEFTMMIGKRLTEEQYLAIREVVQARNEGWNIIWPYNIRRLPD